MNFLTDFNKQIKKQQQGINSMMQNQTRTIKKVSKKQTKNIKSIQKKQTENVKKLMDIKIEGIIGTEGRVPIPAKRKHEVEEEYNHRCADCRKTSSQLGVRLQFHHKNKKNLDNRLVNLELLCPNHHYAKHGKGKNLKRKKKVTFF